MSPEQVHDNAHLTIFHVVLEHRGEAMERNKNRSSVPMLVS